MTTKQWSRKMRSQHDLQNGIRRTKTTPYGNHTLLEESFDHQGLTYDAMAPNFVTPRIMEPQEIAAGVMFLASDAATAFNGMDFDATGGQLA